MSAARRKELNASTFRAASRKPRPRLRHPRPPMVPQSLKAHINHPNTPLPSGIHQGAASRCIWPSHRCHTSNIQTGRRIRPRLCFNHPSFMATAATDNLHTHRVTPPLYPRCHGREPRIRNRGLCPRKRTSRTGTHRLWGNKVCRILTTLIHTSLQASRQCSILSLITSRYSHGRTGQIIQNIINRLETYLTLVRVAWCRNIRKKHGLILSYVSFRCILCGMLL